jgi:hypothetical protein
MDEQWAGVKGWLSADQRIRQEPMGGFLGAGVEDGKLHPAQTEGRDSTGDEVAVGLPYAGQLGQHDRDSIVVLGFVCILPPPLDHPLEGVEDWESGSRLFEVHEHPNGCAGQRWILANDIHMLDPGINGTGCCFLEGELPDAVGLYGEIADCILAHCTASITPYKLNTSIEAMQQFLKSSAKNVNMMSGAVCYNLCERTHELLRMLHNGGH